MLLAVLMANGSADPGTQLQISNGIINVLDGASPYDSHVGIQFRTDGGIYYTETVNSATKTWTYVEDWIDNTGDISGTEEVRFTNLSVSVGSGDFDTESAADDTWATLSGTLEWSRRKTVSGENTWFCDFEIRDTSNPSRGTGVGSFEFDINNIV